MKILQHPRGNTATENAVIGAESQLRYDTQLKQMRVHDGVTPGGYPVPKLADIPGYQVQEFNGVDTLSVPATPMTGAGNKNHLCRFTVAGTYSMIPSADIDVGQGIWVVAKIAAVILQRQGADVFEDKGADVTSLNLVLNETVHILKTEANRYQIMSRY
jgi:hypothetical protein